MDAKLYCVQFRSGYGTKPAFFYAVTAQDAVDKFRSCCFESIVAVFLMEKVGGWK